LLNVDEKNTTHKVYPLPLWTATSTCAKHAANSLDLMMMKNSLQLIKLHAQSNMQVNTRPAGGSSNNNLVLLGTVQQGPVSWPPDAEMAVRIWAALHFTLKENYGI